MTLYIRFYHPTNQWELIERRRNTCPIQHFSADSKEEVEEYAAKNYPNCEIKFLE